MKYNCPVCYKAGLSNYHVQHTICPQCNTDLKPYMLLYSISKPNRLKSFGVISAIAIICFLTFLLFMSVSENRKSKNFASIKNSQLNDSIDTQLPVDVIKQSGQTKDQDLIKEFVIHYKVKEGDYPAKIAAFFYNDWSMYKKIEKDNNLNNHYTLKIGQSLIIKLKQE